MQKEPTTEVISIADEEKRLGREIPVPKGEDLVSKAAASFYQQRRAANALMPSMSKRALIRTINAILDIPTDKVPVYLKNDEEKRLFAAGQRIITDRYIMITHHIKKLAEEEKLKQQEQNHE